MPTGGKREGAGRKPGSLGKATAKMRAEAEASGELPLEYFLRIMRDPNESDERRDRMAMAAAPYLHPRLQATQTQGAVRIEVVDLADAGTDCPVIDSACGVRKTQH